MRAHHPRSTTGRRPPPKRSTAGIRQVAWCLVILACWIALPGSAAAHGSMLSSEPAPLTTVDTAPPEVAVYFSSAILPEGSSIVVTGPDGAELRTGATQVDGASMRVSLPRARPAGTYTVFWQINAADGHQDVGAFEFSAARSTGVGAHGIWRWLAPLSTVALLALLAGAGFFIWRSFTRSGQQRPAPARGSGKRSSRS